MRFRQFHEELLTKYNIWITGGLGEQSEIVSYIWKSYQQAKNARSITTQDRFVLNYSDFLEARDVYYFPESMAVQLSGFISTGNKAQVESNGYPQHGFPQAAQPGCLPRQHAGENPASGPGGPAV